MLCDIITLDGEVIPEQDEYEIFDPNATWKKKKITNYYVENLRKQIFDNGRRVYENRSIKEIKEYCASQLDAMWDEMKRFENPQTYYVDLSPKLWQLKHDMIEGNK